MMWWMAAAFAADVSQFAWVADLRAQPGSVDGVYAFQVPSALRSAADPADGSDLWVVDAQGQTAPVAWLRGVPEEVSVRVQPLGDASHFELTLPEGAADSLRVQLPGADGVARLRASAWDGAAWTSWGEPTQVWRHGTWSADELRGPATRGPLRVEITDSTWEGGLSFRAFANPLPGLQPVTLPAALGPIEVFEDGTARYRLRLPHALPVKRVQFTTDEAIFEREVRVRAVSLVEDWRQAQGTLRRVHWLGTSLEDLTLPIEEVQPSREYEVELPSTGMTPLRLTGATVELTHLAGIVRGTPPFRVYGGGLPGTAPPSDLGVAAHVLARALDGWLEPGEVSDNPAWISELERSGVTLPAVAVDTRARWRAPVTGGPGLVSIPLVDARWDALGGRDLRIEDGEGRQIPYTRYGLAVAEWQEPKRTRTEDAGVSRLVVEHPWPGGAVESLTLETAAPWFARTVTVYQVAGARLIPVRTLRWQGDEHPGALSLHIDHPLSRTFVVEIDNGNNAPLPVSRLAVSRKVEEIRAQLPAGGVWLTWGDPRVNHPNYDLELLQAVVMEREAARAEVGPPEYLGRPSLTWGERLALAAGILAFAVGVLAVLVTGLRPAPAQETPKENPA